MEAASPEAGPEALSIEGFDPMWPVAGAISASFGMTDGGMRYGTEISADSVARVMAPEGGVVIYCGTRGDMGLVIDILHDETGCLSRIIGCQRPLVELYQRVKKGEQVAVLPAPPQRRATGDHPLRAPHPRPPREPGEVPAEDVRGQLSFAAFFSS